MRRELTLKEWLIIATCFVLFLIMLGKVITLIDTTKHEGRVSSVNGNTVEFSLLIGKETHTYQWSESEAAKKYVVGDMYTVYLCDVQENGNFRDDIITKVK